MDISTKQFEKAKKELDLKLVDESKYGKEFVHEDDKGCEVGSVWYNKKQEDYQAYGSVKDHIKNRSSAGNSPVDFSGLKDSEGGAEGLSDLLMAMAEDLFNQAPENTAVVDTKIYTLTTPYEGVRQIMVKNMFGQMEVYSFPFDQSQPVELLHKMKADSFDEVVEELGYEVHSAGGH